VSSSQLVVAGIDFVGSSSEGIHYAIAIAVNGEIIESYENVRAKEVPSILLKFKPSILAVDSPSEIMMSKYLIKFLKKAPLSIKVVQVTKVSPDREVSVEELARQYLNYSGTLTPLKTAEILAILASRGVGTEILFTREIVKIVLVRRKVPGPGGMSQNRYQRSISLKLLTAVREIKKVLEEHNLDYDLFYRKTRYGLQSAIFYVYAPREALKGLVKQVTGTDIKIRIERVLESELATERLKVREVHEVSRKPMIVGVDPGIVTGVALIDLNGNVLFVDSFRELNRRDLIKLVTSLGKPVLVATDVAPAPDYVKKLSSTLGVPLFTPPRSLTVAEKQELVEKYLKKIGYSIRIRDTHQRDALAAALKAYYTYSCKFSQLEALIRDLGLDVKIDEAKVNVIKGYCVKDAILRAFQQTHKQRTEEVKVEYATISRKVKQLEEQVKVLNEKVRVLEEKKSVLEKELERVKRERDELRARVEELEIELRSEAYRDRELREYMNRVSKLEQQLMEYISKVRRLEDERKQLIELLKQVITQGKYVPLIPLEVIERRVPAVGRYGILVKTISVVPEVLSKLKEFSGAIAIVVEQDTSIDKLLEFMRISSVLVVPLNRVRYVVLDHELYLVEYESLLRVQEEYRRELEKRRDVRDMVINIVKEYRQKRLWELTGSVK